MRILTPSRNALGRIRFPTALRSLQTDQIRTALELLMPPETPIKYPARYATPAAVGFASEGNGLSLVSSALPLPVELATRERPAPLAGTASGDITIGPFSPVLGVPITVALAGTWSGMARLLRSTDAGATKHPLSIGGIAWGEMEQPGVQQLWSEFEPGAEFYLDITLYSGTIDYRIAQ